MDEQPGRPWTAEIASPFDGLKSKYNIPLRAVAADGTVGALSVPPPPPAQKRTLSIRQRKEEWAMTLPKGVDYVRSEPEQLTVEQPQQRETTMVQVR